MALYWNEKDIPRHEDRVKKRKITKEDVLFLKNLQHELNTQNHCGTANPRYWGILEEKTYPTSIDYSDYTILIDVEGNEYSLSDLYNEIKEYMEDYPEAFTEISFEDGCLHIETENNYWGFYEFDSDGATDFIEFLHEEHGFDLSLVPSVRRYEIRKNAFFLTQKAATEHLRRNEHNYHPSARTYCLFAHQCHEYENLLKILSEINWEDLDVIFKEVEVTT